MLSFGNAFAERVLLGLSANVPQHDSTLYVSIVNMCHSDVGRIPGFAHRFEMLSFGNAFAERVLLGLSANVPQHDSTLYVSIVNMCHSDAGRISGFAHSLRCYPSRTFLSMTVVSMTLKVGLDVPQ